MWVTRIQVPVDRPPSRKLIRRDYRGPMHTELDRLATEKYLLLTTFRKDGRGVSTPVWAARYGEELVVRTPAEAGKVKRIRRNGTVQVAPCDIRGRARGQSVPGRARLLDPDQMRGAQATMSKLIDQLPGMFAFWAWLMSWFPSYGVSQCWLMSVCTSAVTLST